MLYAIGLCHTFSHPELVILGLRHLGYAMASYRRLERREMLSALQVFWPDKDGRFPTELTCDPPVAAARPRWSLAVPPSELEAFLDRYR